MASIARFARRARGGASDREKFFAKSGQIKAIGKSPMSLAALSQRPRKQSGRALPPTIRLAFESLLRWLGCFVARAVQEFEVRLGC